MTSYSGQVMTRLRVAVKFHLRQFCCWIGYVYSLQPLRHDQLQYTLILMSVEMIMNHIT